MIDQQVVKTTGHQTQRKGGNIPSILVQEMQFLLQSCTS